jgi:hypothetical protein
MQKSENQVPQSVGGCIDMELVGKYMSKQSDIEVDARWH